MWRALAAKILDTLDNTAAFEVLSSMLREMENLSGALHHHQKDLGREPAVEDPDHDDERNGPLGPNYDLIWNNVKKIGPLSPASCCLRASRSSCAWSRLV